MSELVENLNAPNHIAILRDLNVGRRAHDTTY